MDSHFRASPTPPATARPKNSSSSITSSHAATTSNSPQPASMASGSRAPVRGSTPTASRSASKLVDADKPARPASRDSLKQKMLKKPDEPPRPSKLEEQLKSLKSEFDGLRSHLTCKICDRLLYQPYTISCGHTYCYTCLCTWFVSNKARKTCPDCRILVKELPAPAYVIRDMTSVVIARAELLPPGETIEDHKKWQKDEADAVQQDKDNKDSRTGGLFKGCFKAHPLHARGPSLQVVRDQEDGVDRCPICTWELEDGGCTQCGLIFDETGEVSWGDSFTGFSDMDELSEQDTEDLDADMDMDGVDFDGYDDAMDGWGDYPPDQGSFMMRRFLEAGIPPNAAAFARRRPMTHSEAGSRRSYSQSIVSDIYGDEMDTVEEEDEEDSEMNDFIDDGDGEASTSPSATSSTPGPTPRPSNNRARAPGRARRIVESETSSTISSVIEEEEEDEEDQGPIRRGQRNPAQTRVLHRANGSSPSHGPPSSTSTDASTEDLDEDTQALLREEGWMLQRDDDEMGEDDEDDSDTGTTVGWEPLANSNDRSRMGGSLTPTADRPRPSAPIRPPSRAGNIRVLNASRGLRRRSSVLSTSTVHYEDGEADDDDSDQDGDLDMAMNALRTRRSQAQLRNAAAFAHPTAYFTNRGPAQGHATNELDTDDNSDNSQPGTGRRAPRTQRREYDPRISWMFAAHQQALQQHQTAGALIDVEPRSITPVARPRTRNRNRPSPAQAFSPFLPPTRLRTPQMDNTSNIGPASRMPVSPPRRSAMSPALPSTAGAGNMSRFDRAPSVSSTSNASTILTPGTSASSSQLSIDTIAQTQAVAAMDMIDRPQSRVSARPSSAAGRRNSAGFSPVNPPFAHTNMGLHVQGSALPPFQARGNPWAAFVQARGIRSRGSRQVLREQSSTATLRPVSSRANIRDTGNPPQAMRPQASRIQLRQQPSRRQLNNQSSTRTLRASEHARPPPSPGQNVQTASQPVARPIRLTQDERDTRARELIETRRRALGQPGNPPARTNPFTQGFQRPVNPAGASSLGPAPPVSQHVRSNSNESMQSVNSAGTAQGAPTSPVLGRRRSNRNILNAPPPGVLPPSQSTYASPVTAYTNNYYRPRQGSLTGAQPAYESPLTANTRGMNPMMAGPLI
ncbi:E3 ubiquitin ligase [Neocucurbitaria cava]|uniref:E3 ubiquitin ligase n=1 Tax=Neocucurbitaria cava TaxID=798079 RepID=A0A9W9CMK7_9PLEO|nr:E3 ubiquitin ligase [Neocucurbitaria cava]